MTGWVYRGSTRTEVSGVDGEWSQERDEGRTDLVEGSEEGVGWGLGRVEPRTPQKKHGGSRLR